VYSLLSYSENTVEPVESFSQQGVYTAMFWTQIYT